MVVFACPEMNVNVSNYDPQNIDSACYGFLLNNADYVTLNMDYKVTSVDGTPVPIRLKCRIGQDVSDYTIRIKPFSGKNTSLTEMLLPTRR